MFKMDQKVHNFIKGTLENNRKQRKKRKQNDTKIEIDINENQINNNYDVQSYNEINKDENDTKDEDETNYDKTLPNLMMCKRRSDADSDKESSDDEDEPTLIDRVDCSDDEEEKVEKIRTPI